MVHHPDSGLMYLACSRISARQHWLPAVGHLNASGRALDDYVATYDISTGEITRLKIEDAPSRGLHVHGMDIVPSAKDRSQLFVYMVNHRAPIVGDATAVGADSVIEIFTTQVNSGTMKHITTVEDPVIETPNDIVGSPDGKSFYFTNDQVAKTGFVRLNPLTAQSIHLLNMSLDERSRNVFRPSLYYCRILPS